MDQAQVPVVPSPEQGKATPKESPRVTQVLQRTRESVEAAQEQKKEAQQVESQHHVDVDLQKEIDKLRLVAEYAKRKNLSFADAKAEYEQNLAIETRAAEEQLRKQHGDFYARHRNY